MDDYHGRYTKYKTVKQTVFGHMLYWLTVTN